MEEERKKHFILVHGMCHGAWCWYKLATLLRSAGQRVTALDLAASGVHPKCLNELRSFSDYYAPLMEAMASIPSGERVVLVGHSYGGYGIALAAEKFPEKVSVAVFVSAAMPSISAPLSTMDQEPRPSDMFYFYRSRPQLHEGKVVSVMPTGVRPGIWLQDDPTSGDMVTKENYGSVSRVFISCKEDLCLEEDFQHWMIAESPGVEVKEIEAADHMVMLSKPKELCNLLLEIANNYK
ncbi:esterase PIR7B isoform X2 [Elaeis guineensis]|uniref:esterase PIR7B isoform X2 n=1 Tax=Elaeis guineensis var. tenera TaxID=51953 RepID=UPI003C6D7382